MKIKVINIGYWRIDILVRLLFYVGIVIAYLGSLNPWFMWPLGNYYIIIASVLLCMSIAISSIQKETSFFTNERYIIPITIHIVLSYYLLWINGGHIAGFIVNLFNISIFYTLFILNKDVFPTISTIISKVMASLLLISIIAYVLYLLGFHFPYRDAEFADGFYSYKNYYFFMIDQRSLLEIFPRFHSVFLEPGHLGSACVLLLLTQYGNWKKWYNIVLLIATLMTFSLAAYVLLTIIVFLNLWLQGKRVMYKLVVVVLMLTVVTIASFYYNNGNNLLHDLIILRLEINDGEMVGNNRTTADFETEFDNYITSSDVLTGRDMPKGMSGNSGYKVFIYENGLIGLVLVLLLYVSSMWYATNYKALIATYIIAILAFVIRGYPLWYSNFIPLYIMAYMNKDEKRPYNNI